MDRSNSPQPHGLMESLVISTLESLQGLQHQAGQMSAKVDALLQNQASNKADILDRVEQLREDTHRRIDDMLPRMASLEESRRSSPEAPSFAAKLFGVVGAFLIEKLPWKRIVFLGSGVLIGVMGHAMPERVRALGASLLDAWSKGLLPQ